MPNLLTQSAARHHPCLCVVQRAPRSKRASCASGIAARRRAQIHALLEADFVPLELCARLAPLLEALEGLNKPLSAASPVPDALLGQYKRALQQARPGRGTQAGWAPCDATGALVPEHRGGGGWYDAAACFVKLKGQVASFVHTRCLVNGGERASDEVGATAGPPMSCPPQDVAC